MLSKFTFVIMQNRSQILKKGNSQGRPLPAIAQDNEIGDLTSFISEVSTMATLHKS